ncbi:uncharacterized protein CC84DRAFT_1167507 [Paraphaeosphaeria sporulosa]|uniref:Uncharacterized protein n=1 Tax=Paraphaeosphaeria sporulosa TaxID=1460663 RepID=A0A177C6Y4_9PLEO|nr:uncharacterized protein CC84DRAFT_1167507 [Paraphaeosphaeria sporulosa]OAG02460.1 hypothetical protein CC84DRAFT_1167507 [Paraphaeosphaeria sporulosa]
MEEGEARPGSALSSKNLCKGPCIWEELGWYGWFGLVFLGFFSVGVVGKFGEEFGVFVASDWCFWTFKHGCLWGRVCEGGRGVGVSGKAAGARNEFSDLEATFADMVDE